jgi:signal transduction histidine kinase
MVNIKYFKNLGITTKFILWFLFISILPLAIAINISYSNYQKVLIDQEKKNLFAVADNKVNQVKVYLNDREKNATSLSNMSDIVDMIVKYNEAFANGGRQGPDYAAADQEFRPFLSYHKKIFGYDNLFLVGSGGELLFSAEIQTRVVSSLYKAALDGNSELANTFVRAVKSGKTEISDFEYDPQRKEGAIFIAVPIFEGSSLIGAVVCQLNNKGLFELVNDFSGLGETGEIILASRMNQKAVFITPLRFDKEAAFEKQIDPASPEGGIIIDAIKGDDGSGMYVDYRGKKVLAVWRHLGLFRLGMIVKMDVEEIFSTADRLRNSLLAVGLGLLVLVIVLAVVIARTMTSPIKELTTVARTISGGDFSARAKTRSSDEIGALAHSFNQMTDDLMEATANLAKQKQLLEAANKELDSFVYTVSHDLKAPLRGIDAFANFLKEDYAGKLDEKARDYIKRICAGANRMKEFIEDLLTLSRISRIQNPYENVDMANLIKSVMEKVDFDVKTHKVEVVIAKALPVVYCDRIKITEVFLNLITNAIKFSSKNKETNPRVEVGYSDKGHAHEFYVKDNGIGIDKKYHQEVFGIFRRLHTQEEYEGTGAGLSIAKKIIEDHKGSIWIDSEPGKGATFYFTIPKQLQEKKMIGQILIEEGKVSQEDLKRALEKQSLP